VCCEARRWTTPTLSTTGNIVREVIGGVFTLPTAPPAAELRGLAARFHSAMPAQRSALADQVIACAVALGGTPEAIPSAELSTH
jgi:hypothetical protein